MADTTVSAAMASDHREIDEGFTQFREGLSLGERRREPLARAAAALRRHIYLEEEILFPPLGEAGLAPPVAVMFEEHGAIWGTLDDITRCLDEESDVTSIQQAYDSLVGILGEHNRKEEGILYPAADRLLDSTVSSQVLEFLDRGVPPADWICGNLRRAGNAK